nr:MAG TPA: hypothetical protein [Caudoviricetes sp.]
MKIPDDPAKVHTVGCGGRVISCVQSPGHRTKGGRTSWGRQSPPPG